MTRTLPMQRGGCPFDPPAELGRLREKEPLSRLLYPDGHLGWLVTSHALAREVLADDRFSARSELRRMPVRTALNAERELQKAPPGMFTNMDAPEHTRYRRLLTGHLTVKRMKLLEPLITRITEDLLDEMERHGPTADLLEAFAAPIPALVMCELLGIPYPDREQFQRDLALLSNLRSGGDDAKAAIASIQAFFADLIRDKRANPGDDLLSGLATSTDLTDAELTGMGFLLLAGGHETTANMLSLGAFALLCHPEEWARLRADRSLVGNTVEELLRYLTIFQIGTMRAALEDVELDGKVVKAGETVSISFSAANRDPERFPDPDRLDITRSTSGHMGFGHGVHQCIGQQLARVEMRIGFDLLSRRFPTLRLAVPAEDVPMRHNMSFYGVDSLPVAW
ncbi:cytochrome P450 [Streptomyces sp. UNOB3_S3]|uniref:cytochrome P450 n=1 Tax=Streptomyces sp. UNOB3_S3 TaxID=2871682 RepID=UPI001E4855CE|nr:cytochrome P450 [Streptomyces sp. UNOB3_S3]MCC3775009.1 cytochrome P450 [Streptomyces sp. UNOB3_S3]